MFESTKIIGQRQFNLGKVWSHNTSVMDNIDTGCNYGISLFPDPVRECFHFHLWPSELCVYPCEHV